MASAGTTKQTKSKPDKAIGFKLQFLVTMLSFIATLSIGGNFQRLESDRIAKGVVILTCSILTLLFSFIKVRKKLRSVIIERDTAQDKHHEGWHHEEINLQQAILSFQAFIVYVAAYKAIFVQIVDATFDAMVAISLFIDIEYGQNQSLLLTLTSSIGLGEEVIELILDCTWMMVEGFAEKCWMCMRAVVVIEFIGCILELSFGIYLGAQILNSDAGVGFFIVLVIVFSILICVIIFACYWFFTNIREEGKEWTWWVETMRSNKKVTDGWRQSPQ